MPPPKLLDQVRAVVRVKHFSLSTERAYVGWIRRFILFHNKKHPKEMAETEIREFISDLAVNARISASTQTVALSGLIFSLGRRAQVGRISDRRQKLARLWRVAGGSPAVPANHLSYPVCPLEVVSLSLEVVSLSDSTISGGAGFSPNTTRTS